MRRLEASGVCWCCGADGPVAHSSYSRPLELGDLLVECDLGLPDLCDTCDYAQRRWEAAEWCKANPGGDYPYADPPPASPPVRR